MKLLKSVFLIYILTVMQLFANERYDYGKEIQLKGKLITELHYGSPGFGENPEEDKKVYPYILILDKRIDVNGNDFNDEEKDVAEIQITFSSNMAEKIKMLKGKNIKLTGTLFHGENGNHFTNVLVDVNKIDKIQEK